jgi:hypothetical protein
MDLLITAVVTDSSQDAGQRVGGSMGDNYRFRDMGPGRGQSNIGRGGRNYQDNRTWQHVDNRGGHYVGGNHYDHRHYQRDEYNIDYQTGPADPFDAMASGRGVGRLLTALGLIIAFAGFAGWMYVIFSGMNGGFDKGRSFFSMELVPGVPIAPVAFGAVAVGGIVASIGAAMARAARRRYEQAMRQHRRRRY